jgi:hypothetical protein
MFKLTFCPDDHSMHLGDRLRSRRRRRRWTQALVTANPTVTETGTGQN